MYNNNFWGYFMGYVMEHMAFHIVQKLVIYPQFMAVFTGGNEMFQTIRFYMLAMNGNDLFRDTQTLVWMKL